EENIHLFSGSTSGAIHIFSRNISDKLENSIEYSENVSSCSIPSISFNPHLKIIALVTGERGCAHSDNVLKQKSYSDELEALNDGKFLDSQ
ncbi:MAG: hypothetical protein MHPSP_003932, partial [Paramarteilia canceri]